MGFMGIDQITSQDQLKCAAFAHETRQPLRSAIAGNDSELDFRLTEPGVFRGDTNGACHRRFTTTSKGEAIHCCDHRLSEVLDKRKHFLAELGEVACRLTVERRELRDICASNERLFSRASQNDAFDCDVVLRRMKQTAEFFNGLPVERVQYLGAIHGDVSGRSFDLIRDVFEAGGYFSSAHKSFPLS